MYFYPFIRGDFFTGMCGVTRVICSPTNPSTGSLWIWWRVTIRRDHDLAKPLQLHDHVAASDFSIRDTNHHHVLPTTFVCSVPFRLERAPQESITAGCFKFEGVLPYSVRCDSEFHFQGTYVETEMPLTTPSFVFYKNSAGN